MEIKDLLETNEILKAKLRDAEADRNMYRCYANESKSLRLKEHDRAEIYKGLFASAVLLIIAIAAVFTIYNYGG